MGNHVVWWPRRHSVARVHKVGDWMGLGTKAPNITPFEVEPVGGARGEAVVANGLRRDLEVARGAQVAVAAGVARSRGRPRKK